MAFGVWSSVFTSFATSKQSSALASGLFRNENTLPCSCPAKSRSLPGAATRHVGLSSLMLGNALTVLYGGGGSGEPTIFEAVHGTRGSPARAVARNGRITPVMTTTLVG